MALVICPECGKEVSDKAVSCIHCGCPLNEEISHDTTQKVEITSVDIKGGNLKKTIISIVIILVVVLGGLFAYSTIQEQAEAEKIEIAKTEYIENVNLAVSEMLLGAITSESVSTLIHDVWYNAIYEESNYQTDKYTKNNGRFVSDFNEALNAYMTSSDYSTSYDTITTNEETVQNYMKKVQTPPEGMTNLYNTLSDLHSAYLKMTSNATNPQGNLTSYTQSCNDASKEFMNLYDKIQSQIPEE